MKLKLPRINYSIISSIEIQDFTKIRNSEKFKQYLIFQVLKVWIKCTLNN